MPTYNPSKISTQWRDIAQTHGQVKNTSPGELWVCDTLTCGCYILVMLSVMLYSVRGKTTAAEPLKMWKVKRLTRLNHWGASPTTPTSQPNAHVRTFARLVFVWRWWSSSAFSVAFSSLSYLVTRIPHSLTQCRRRGGRETLEELTSFALTCYLFLRYLGQPTHPWWPYKTL